MLHSNRLQRLLRTSLFLLMSALGASASAQTTPTAVVTTAQVRAELMAHAPEGVAPGKTVWVGLQLNHQPRWHTYWKNSGDSGLPTRLQWTLPAGVSAGDIAWPLPHKFLIGNLANFGYEGTVLLPVPLTITPTFNAATSDLDLQLKASWLVCRETCIPEDGEFALRLPLRGSTAINGGLFEASLKSQPAALAGTSQVVVEGNTLQVSVSGLPAALVGQTLEFFPETGGVIKNAANWSQQWRTGTQPAVWTARVPLDEQRTQSPAQLPLLLVAEHGGQRQGFTSAAPVTGNWPKVAELAELSPALTSALTPGAGAPASAPALPLSLWAALAGALLGGLILNLMPCVFPVLAIKVVSFARHAGDRRGHRISGIAYAGGVILSFLALGALMLALRSAGEQLGWGFQLQSPALVAALAILFTVLGLNLAGLFEFGSILPARLATLEARHPALNAFLSGVLAVAIASPCTAPFMGASLGLALGLPASQALLVFGAIGVGMALPYLTASLIPAAAKLLPRPGAWMGIFRRAMAFPMFATVVWLVWVLGQQSGIDGAGALLALLVAFSLVLWAFTLSGRARLVMAGTALAVLALLSGALGPYILEPVESAPTASRTADRWQAWSPDRVEQALAQGAPVFVDFTAAWCVTCQYNKKTTLADSGVLADLDGRKVTLLRADWTRRDPAITAALGQLGRNGVPVYVLYKAGRAPVVLSEILSPQEIHSALATL